MPELQLDESGHDMKDEYIINGAWKRSGDAVRVGKHSVFVDARVIQTVGELTFHEFVKIMSKFDDSDLMSLPVPVNWVPITGATSTSDFIYTVGDGWEEETLT